MRIYVSVVVLIAVAILLPGGSLLLAVAYARRHRLLGENAHGQRTRHGRPKVAAR